LYIEETTKTLLESGYLKDMDGRYELTGTLPALAIPSTLQDSLMARLDRLVTAKGIAQYASVIGRQFSYELLQAVLQLDETILQHELGRLVEAELVYQRGLLPHAIYTFKHALIQDAAYESLLRCTRQGYHQRIAEVLAERFAETARTQPELLAYHYIAAGVHEQAIDYWSQAGQQAVEHSVLLPLSPDNATEAESCFHQAIAIAQNQSAKSWELRAVTSLAKLWQSQGKRQEAYDLLAPVYGWFTEGFDTADLKDTKALLDELS
jgi:hypothetical protein